MVALYCTYCAALHGQCKTDCQGNQLSTQLSINKTLTGLLEYGAISQNRRRAGNRTKIVNSTAKMVNITAYPAAIHPVTLKTFKLEQGAAVNNVFTLDSTYDQVVSEIQNYLFPYPQWKFANYELSTSDGARIIENTPFSRFPFNLSSSGKKTLWLIRKESQDLHRPAIDCTDDHLLCNDDTYLPFELPNDICEGRSLADIPVIVDPPKKKSTCPNAFGIHPEISYPEFHQFYDEAKDDRGSNTNAVAILRQYDVSTTPPRWKEKFLYDYTAPDLEDPVEDGGCKTVFKDGLFKCVFGEAPVAYKVSRDTRNNSLGLHGRSVQNMALAAAAAIEFDRTLDRKFHIQFCDSVIVELLPESVDLVAKPGSQLQKMCQRGVIWIVERQLRSKAFVKLVSNTGAIIQAQECRSARAKKDKMIATAFAHWSWIHSKRRCMFMDLQGAQGQFADVEIVTAEHSPSEFGCGNLELARLVNSLKNMNAIWCVTY